MSAIQSQTSPLSDRLPDPQPSRHRMETTTQGSSLKPTINHCLKNLYHSTPRPDHHPNRRPHRHRPLHPHLDPPHQPALDHRRNTTHHHAPLNPPMTLSEKPTSLQDASPARRLSPGQASGAMRRSAGGRRPPPRRTGWAAPRGSSRRAPAGRSWRRSRRRRRPGGC